MYDSYVYNNLPVTKPPSPIIPPEGVASVCKINISGYSLDNFRTFNPEGYTVLCRLGESCDGLSFFPKTSKIVVNLGNVSFPHENLEKFVPNVAKDLGITHDQAASTAVDFLADKELIVQPVGIQGKVYNFMQGVQNYIPMAYASKTVTLLKTTGQTGVKIVTSGPLVFVGVTYMLAISCGYFGSVAGDNAVGYIFNQGSYVFSRPMWCVETILNGVILRPISHLTGFPLILNGTQELLQGSGMNITDYKKIGESFERIRTSKKIKTLKLIGTKLKDVWKLSVDFFRPN